MAILNIADVPVTSTSEMNGGHLICLTSNGSLRKFPYTVEASVFLTEVIHDTTLTGKGTSADTLKVDVSNLKSSNELWQVYNNETIASSNSSLNPNKICFFPK